MAAIVEISGLTIVHDRHAVLSGLGFAVERATVHCIVGPNGTGKSSLVGALLGQVAFRGEILCHFEKGGQIGFVPQTFAVDRTLPVTVDEFLALTRQRWPISFGVTRTTRTKTSALLARVGLPSFGARRLSTLSGGELRRVLLANALDPEPELIVLDEPSSGLDQESIAAMERTLLQLRDERGVTVLMVSHDPEQVRRLADRVTRLERQVADRSAATTGTVREIMGLA